MDAKPTLQKSWFLAEFTDATALCKAVETLRLKGFTDLDTYSPYPLHGTSEALALPRSKVPLIALCGGLTGAISAYSFQFWMNAVDFPINVGNRPPHSGPAFIPITFEFGVLLAALSIFFGLLALSRLPQPYHPAFQLDAFRSASTHAFWLSVALPEADRASECESVVKEHGALQFSTFQEDP